MTPERPAFFDGQILAAADLTSAVDYGRGQAARHERYLHDWGIAEGLELTTAPDSSGQYVDVTLQPGVAIDGDGREIVVPASVLLSTAEFFIANGASPQAGANYPILLHGLDTSRARRGADHRRLRARRPADPHRGRIRPDLRRPRCGPFPRRAAGTGRDRGPGTCCR